MAKKKKGKGGGQAGEVPAAKSTVPASLLEAAWQAFSSGDMVVARRACAQLLSSPDAAREGPFAARLGPELFGTKDAPVDAAAVANELMRRTEVPARTYWFAGLAAFVFVVLLLIAHRG